MDDEEEREIYERGPCTEKSGGLWEDDVFSETNPETESVSTDLREEMDNLREEVRALQAARFAPPPEYEP